MLGAGAAAVLFGLSWLQLAAIFETQSTPPINSIGVFLIGSALYQSRRPFRRGRMAIPLGCCGLGIGLIKPALGLSGVMLGIWTMTNSTLICLLAIAVLLVSLQRPVAAQTAAFLVLVLLLVTVFALYYSMPGPKTAIFMLYVSGFLIVAGVFARTAYRGPLRRVIMYGPGRRYALMQAAVLAVALMVVTVVSVEGAIDPYVVPLVAAVILTLTWLLLVKLMPFVSKPSETRTASPLRQRVVRELDAALEADQFTVYFQPQVKLATGRLIGAEALVRWNHPERGLVPPADFIPIAEESGRIVEIGYSVLEKACTQALRWPDEIGPLELSVNISPVQLQAPDLVQNVVRILEETGFDANRLVLELTETGLVRRGEPGFATIWALHDLGLSIAIDDFGTGYSCLAYLSDLPVQYLKIDQSFVRKLQVDEASATIARSIVGLGHGLGQKIIAEGIETVDQEAFLRDIHCDKGQGYHYARPMSGEAFALWANSRDAELVRNETRPGRQAV